MLWGTEKREKGGYRKQVEEFETGNGTNKGKERVVLSNRGPKCLGWAWQVRSPRKPFRRKDPASGKQSCLDLFIVSKELLPYVTSLKIDSERKRTVARAVKMGAIYSNVYSDHYSCILTLTGLPRIQERRRESRVMWNLAKEGGWNRYFLLTDEYSEPFEKAIKILLKKNGRSLTKFMIK